MKNDKNWPHENNVQHLKKIYRVLSTVQFARETQKTKNGSFITALCFTYLQFHCPLCFCSCLEFISLKLNQGKIYRASLKSKAPFFKSFKIKQPTFLGIDDKVQILHILLRSKFSSNLLFNASVVRICPSCQKHWSDDDVAIMMVREVQETSWGFGAHAKISAGAHHYRDHASLLFLSSFQ